MKRLPVKFALLILTLGIVLSSKSDAADGDLIPLLKDAQVHAEISFNNKSGTYTYSYSIANPASNSADINCIEIDIAQKHMTEKLGGGEFTLQGSYKTETFNKKINRRNSWFRPPPMIPVGVKAPPEWFASLEEKGTVQLNYWEENPIRPGTTQDGFLLDSLGLPGIRKMYIIPSWYFRVLGKKDTIHPYASLNREKPIKYDFAIEKKTVGPAAPPTDSTGKFSPAILLDSIDGYISDSVKLGWLNDRKLAGDLQAQLNSVIGAVHSNNPESVKKGLKKFLEALNEDRSMLSAEAYGLLSLNAQYLITRLPDSGISPTILLELKAEKSSLNVGAANRFTAKLTVNGKPLAGHKVTLKGVHSDTTEPLPVSPDSSLLEDISHEITDKNGRATFKYASKKEFAVTFVAETELKGGEKAFSKTVGAKWSGGPDLVASGFPESYHMARGGEALFFRSGTKNNGNAPAGASIMRHYLSDKPRGQEGARVWQIDEHKIPPLEPGHEYGEQRHQHKTPSDVPQGRYYKWTCVDTDNQVIETNEVNNCGSHEEEGISFFGIMRRVR